MTEIDPYVVLGVPRSATRIDVARAYRALARQHHPDAGAPAGEQMVRINEAWRVLSDPARRARWDRQHTIVEPSPWRAPGMAEAPRTRRQPTPPPAPATPMETPQRVAAIAIGVLAVAAATMAVLTLSAGPPPEFSSFDSPDVSFSYPADWTVAEGEPSQDPAHRVIAHLVTFPLNDEERCTSFDDPCPLTGEGMPAEGASVVITAWEGGTPRIADPESLEAGGIGGIGGAPSAFRFERSSRTETVAWWQLSPPGFPARWIEVRADIAGPQRERQALFDDVVRLLESLEFQP
ncbi:MAG: J domain-containing protein [Candidatus Limnocylindria bacterium]